jgi:hypothetical protein
VEQTRVFLFFGRLEEPKKTDSSRVIVCSRVSGSGDFLLLEAFSSTPKSHLSNKSRSLCAQKRASTLKVNMQRSCCDFMSRICRRRAIFLSVCLTIDCFSRFFLLSLDWNLVESIETCVNELRRSNFGAPKHRAANSARRYF